jgi:hypothetical protein
MYTQGLFMPSPRHANPGADLIRDKGQGARDTTRTWYSKEHVVNHLAGLLKTGKTKEERARAQARFGGMHKKLSAELDESKAALQERRNNGENPGNLYNQEHPDHRCGRACGIGHCIQRRLCL